MVPDDLVDDVRRRRSLLLLARSSRQRTALQALCRLWLEMHVRLPLREAALGIDVARWCAVHGRTPLW